MSNKEKNKVKKYLFHLIWKFLGSAETEFSRMLSMLPWHIMRTFFSKWEDISGNTLPLHFSIIIFETFKKFNSVSRDCWIFAFTGWKFARFVGWSHPGSRKADQQECRHTVAPAAASGEKLRASALRGEAAEEGRRSLRLSGQDQSWAHFPGRPVDMKKFFFKKKKTSLSTVIK